jgi:aromatic amino acid aminotransferase I
MFTERGDNIIVEEYTYPALMETASPLGVKCVPAKMDEYTLRPDALDELLRSWDEAKWGKRPRVIYLVPTGQNPSGATASLSRRREIYAVVQKWDLYILEDDPYYFIQFEPSLRTKTSGDRQCSPQELATALTPSYLSMDIDGRVLRMDTFSKVIAPGLRMGWVTASEQVVERLVRAQETSVQNPSGLSQLVTYRLFKNWSDIGFMNWILDIQSVYLTKRGVLATLIAKHLPPEIISYDLPKAGFFVSVGQNIRSKLLTFCSFG